MVTPDLTTLNVDWNGLDSEVAAIMSRWLLDSQSMQHITYSNNNIDAKGAIEIAKILEDNMSLNIWMPVSIHLDRRNKSID